MEGKQPALIEFEGRRFLSFTWLFFLPVGGRGFLSSTFFLLRSVSNINNMKLTPEQVQACKLVENLLRSLGGRCIQVSVTPTEVEVAPVEWSGSSTGNTLSDALEDALIHE